MQTYRYTLKDLSTGNEEIREFTGYDNEVFSVDSIACKKVKDEAARSLIAYWNYSHKGKRSYTLLSPGH
jgi:hypothetical protein